MLDETAQMLVAQELADLVRSIKFRVQPSGVEQEYPIRQSGIHSVEWDDEAKLARVTFVVGHELRWFCLTEDAAAALVEKLLALEAS